MHNRAPVVEAVSDYRPGDDRLSGLEKGKATIKYALLWRSIILSCLNPAVTYDAYAKSVRKLDFDDLEQLLENQQFRGRASRYDTDSC